MNEWPFIIIRSYGTGFDNDVFTNHIFSANERHPGLVNEIWFGGNSLDGLDEVRKKAANNVPYRERCHAHGIQFSFQQGITLNHAPDWKDRPHFTDAAWTVDETGRLCKGLLCPRSEEAREYTRREVEFIMSELKPDSYWPDDDLRLAKNYLQGHMFCFCDRCLAAFNAEYHHSFGREALWNALTCESGQPQKQIRAEWSEFNAESMAQFASIFREVADRVHPACRLGLQSVAVVTGARYNGADFLPTLKALSGANGNEVGIRPGDLCYLDRGPRDMFQKSLAILKEGARCRKYGFIGQICAEVENWPHIGAEKNPCGQMAESSLYLASGADSLALYWGTDQNRESDELNRFYFDTLAAWKPFFLSIREAFDGAEVSGAALFRGSDLLAHPDWMEQLDVCEIRLMENAVPVTRMESAPEVFVLDQRAVVELAECDFPTVFAKSVLMDVPAFQDLAKRFFSLKFTKKVSIHSFEELAPATSARVAYEVFDGDKRAMDLYHMIRPESDDVRPCSTVTGAVGICGTCVIPTEFGGSVVLMQELANYFLWTGYRRKTVLDALDSLLVGGMSVRLLTGGFSICVIGRKNVNGKTVGAYLLNAGIGRTMPLELAIRNPAFAAYRFIRPEEDPVDLTPIRETDGEKVFSLPPLHAWEPMLIAGIAER